MFVCVWFFIVSVRKSGGESALNCEIPYVFIIFHFFHACCSCIYKIYIVSNGIGFPFEAHLFDFHNPSSFVVFFSVHVFVNFATRACICVCVCVRALFRSEHSMHFLHLPLCRIYLSNESHKIENTFFVGLGTPSSEH